MSSHHFVKDGQEPALLILDPLSFEIAAPLLEWAPMVITAEVAAERILSWGIKIDALLTKQKNMATWVERLTDQAPVNIVPYHDTSGPLAAGLDLLRSVNQKNVIIFNVEAISLFPVLSFLPHLSVITLIDGQNKWSRMLHGHFEKWLPEGTPFFLHKSDEFQQIKMTGLKRSGQSFEAERSALIQISSDKVFWVGEPL